MATEIGVVLVRTVAAATLVTLLVGCCLRCLHRTDLRSADVGVGCAGHGDPDPAAGCADGHPDPGPEFTDDLPALLAVAPDRLRTDCPVIASMELSSRYRYCRTRELHLGGADGTDPLRADDRRDGPHPRRFGW